MWLFWYRGKFCAQFRKCWSRKQNCPQSWLKRVITPNNYTVILLKKYVPIVSRSLATNGVLMGFRPVQRKVDTSLRDERFFKTYCFFKVSRRSYRVDMIFCLLFHYYFRLTFHIQLSALPKRAFTAERKRFLGGGSFYKPNRNSSLRLFLIEPARFYILTTFSVG